MNGGLLPRKIPFDSAESNVDGVEMLPGLKGDITPVFVRRQDKINCFVGEGCEAQDDLSLSPATIRERSLKEAGKG